MAVKGVVFDFGGVMTTSTMPERVRRCTEKFGIDWSALETGYQKYRRIMDGGFITIAEMYDNIWADAGIEISQKQFEEILEEDFASFMEGNRNPATLKWMRKLKAEGFKIGILTNMPPEFEVRFRKVYADYIELADAMVVSGLEHMFKPQRRIYDLLRDRIGLMAEELVFVDDTEPNLEGARKAGWKTVKFVDAESAAKALEELCAC